MAAAALGMATSQIAFLGDDGVQVAWDVSGSGMFDSTPLVIPGRQDFYQGAIYRLKLSNIPGRAGIQLYPTLEVAPVTPRTDAYLAHSPIPVQFTEEDFDQVVSGNFVTKVIYLPDPEFQELALAGVETLVSTRLDPGVDPIAEADRRGSILAIVRMGNKDLELGGGTSGQPGTIVPARHEEPRRARGARRIRQQPKRVQQAADEQPADNQTASNDVTPAQYCEGGQGFDGGAPCMATAATAATATATARWATCRWACRPRGFAPPACAAEHDGRCVRNGVCRSRERRSACLVRRTCRWALRPVCRST